MAQGFDLRHLSRYAQATVSSFLPFLLSAPPAAPCSSPATASCSSPAAAYLLCPAAAPALPICCALLPPCCALLLLPLFLLLLVLGLEVGQEGWIWGQKNALAAPRGQTDGIRRMIVSALLVYQRYHQVFFVLFGWCWGRRMVLLP